MINGLCLKNAVISGANNIIKHKNRVNELNIFPVPDGDTGTNMSMTISSAVEALKNVSVKEALNHPNWKMGNKITIDSATMTNKMFELLEAFWLFGTKKLDAIIEPKSLVHAFVNFTDGSTTAHIANASMQLPIAYALLDKIEDEILKPVDLLEISSLEFKKIESSRYPIWDLKNEILDNPDLGVILNAANEVGVEKFLNGKIGFLDISKISIDAINKFHNTKASNIDDIFQIDKEVRKYCDS